MKGVGLKTKKILHQTRLCLQTRRTTDDTLKPVYPNVFMGGIMIVVNYLKIEFSRLIPFILCILYVLGLEGVTHIKMRSLVF
jgi:hypothetical protein